MTRGWTLGDVFVLRHAGFPFDWLESLGLSEEVLAGTRALLGLTPGTDAWDAQWARAESTYDDDRARLRVRLRALAGDAQVQEAVFLSSPDMFDNVWRRYVEHDAPGHAPRDATDDSRSRRVERQVYSYLQRFCAKNETTSFFGPMGYGEIEGDDDVVEIHRVAPARRTFVAYWAVEALAAAIAGEPELWGQLPCMRNPLFAVDAAARVARCAPLEREEPLTEDELRLLAALPPDGTSDAGRLAETMGVARALVERAILSLARKLVVVRRVPLRSDRPDVLADLRGALAALAPGPVRDRWLTEIDALDAVRAQFEGAAFAQRPALLASVERLFTKASGVPARRAGGRLYTDRLVINEEASSPFRLRVGARAARALEASLSPLLEICAAAGDSFQEECRTLAGELLGASGGELPLLDYASRLREAHVAPPKASTVTVPAGARRAELPLDVCGLASSESRFALPDVSIGRDASGALHVVLASLHHNLLTRGWMFTFYPDADRASRVATRWLGEAARTHALPLVELASGRHNKGFYSFPGPRVANASAEMIDAGHGVLMAADLCVTLEPGSELPVVRGAGEPFRLYLPLADLTLHPPFAALTSPMAIRAPIAVGAEHAPRFDVGSATYQRERWTTELARKLAKRRGFALFVETYRERLRLGMPRFVFAKVAAERKPFLVDLECPFALDLLRHLATAEVTFEEMLPAPDQLWLRDERGRYTFELRMQASRVAGPSASRVA